jgi:hypothetical protein
MFDRMLQHRPSYVLNPLNRRNLNNVSLRSENNKIQRLVNLDYVKDICPVSVENLMWIIQKLRIYLILKR